MGRYAFPCCGPTPTFVGLNKEPNIDFNAVVNPKELKNQLAFFIKQLRDGMCRGTYKGAPFQLDVIPVTAGLYKYTLMEYGASELYAEKLEKQVHEKMVSVIQSIINALKAELHLSDQESLLVVPWDKTYDPVVYNELEKEYFSAQYHQEQKNIYNGRKTLAEAQEADLRNEKQRFAKKIQDSKLPHDPKLDKNIEQSTQCYTRHEGIVVMCWSRGGKKQDGQYPQYDGFFTIPELNNTIGFLYANWGNISLKHYRVKDKTIKKEEKKIKSTDVSSSTALLAITPSANSDEHSSVAFLKSAGPILISSAQKALKDGKADLVKLTLEGTLGKIKVELQKTPVSDSETSTTSTSASTATTSSDVSHRSEEYSLPLSYTLSDIEAEQESFDTMQDKAKVRRCCLIL